MGGKTPSEYMFSEYPQIADIVGAPIASQKISLRRSNRQLSRCGQLRVKMFAEAFAEFAEDPQ